MFCAYCRPHGTLHKDGDDAAILGGIGTLDGQPVTVLAQVKGRDLKENQQTNFSMPHPEGYRKALRLAKQAEKFHRPVVCLIDTPGAFCGIGAEERGQGEAIARNLMEFMQLETPVISIVLGEGGSGGALAIELDAGDDAERDLFGDFAAWVRVDPLERPFAREGSGKYYADHSGGPG